MVARMADEPLTTLSGSRAGNAAPRRRATLREVAALAGVSIKTVSRVVNSEPGVRSDLVRRVEDAAERLDYRPNLAASALRRAEGKTRTVGLMLEDVANPYSSAVHRAIGDAAALRGVAVLATSLDEDPVREREVARAMILRRVDGLVIVPTGSDQGYLRNEMEAGLAIVFVDRPPSFLDADSVIVTNRDGAREAVEHLLAQGHRRIAFLGDLAAIATAQERWEGYATALRRAGVALDERIVRRDLHDRDASERAVTDLLALPPDVRPTALFTSQNLVTIGALHALRRHGAQHGVALVGFDDFELADLVEPGVTVVAQDPYAIGRAASELLVARLDGDHGPTQRIVVPTRLVVRGSGEVRPPSPGSNPSRG
jgi:LacI family transcriptional regulator